MKMETNDLSQAINALRKQEARRRSMPFTLVVVGMMIAALGGWVQYRAAQLIGDAIEGFYDTPSIAIGVVSGISPTVTIGRLQFFFGVGLALFGLVPLFYPDPKNTVLLALYEQSKLDIEHDNEKPA